MTGPDLASLWRERQQAGAEHEESGLEPEGDPAWQRYTAADRAIRAARPNDVAGLAVQARLLENSLEIGQIAEDVDLVRAIALQPEAMAPPPTA